VKDEYMLRRVVGFSVLLCLMIFCAHMLGQTQPEASAPAATPAAAPALPNPQTPQEFFARARALSDLEASGIPFHLKATYVASGDAEFTGNGTYEEWWQSKDLWRKEATLGDFKYLETEYGGKNSAYGRSDYIPLRLRQMLDAVIVRIDADTGTASKWKLKQERLNGIDLVVLYGKDFCQPPGSHFTCPIKDYFAAGGILRIHAQDLFENLYNGMEPFRGLLIPRSIVLAENAATILTVSIVSLESMTPNEMVLATEKPNTVGMQAINSPNDVKIRKGEKPPRITSFAEAKFPRSERIHQQANTTVTIACEIDSKGMVREPYVLLSAGQAFDQSALGAVRKFKFAPATMKGIPETSGLMIKVSFRLY
jgi:TonB family protein